LCIAYNLELEIRISYGDWRQLDELNVWTLSITLTGKSKVFMTLHSAFAIEAMERIKDNTKIRDCDCCYRRVLSRELYSRDTVKLPPLSILQ
jgi:hypothetical protein